MITFEQIQKDEAIRTYIAKANESLAALGYTEHGFAHVANVAAVSAYILQTLGYCEKDVELVRIAAYLHDVGNLVNRVDHSQSGAVMAFRMLHSKDMDPADIATIVTAIGNHDEGTGIPVNAIAAALIIGDKTDVRRSRVRNTDERTFDIHDRVNYSVTESRVRIDERHAVLTSALTIDTHYCSVMDYFEIFLGRMILCRKAADKLGLEFRLTINGQQLM